MANFRILEPSSGHLYYNGSTLSEKVCLGIEADPNEWREVTLEEAAEIKANIEKLKEIKQ